LKASHNSSTVPEQIVFWFLLTMAIGICLTAACPGCTATQRAEARAAHNAACMPTLAVNADFNAAAVRNGLDPYAAARAICAVPDLAAKLVEGAK
jgi:hypothetical protein